MELQHLIVEHSTKETIAERYWTESVTMTDAESITTDLHQRRLLEAPHAQFLKIIICPDVMVALEEIHIDTPVHQCCKRSEHPHIALGNNITILIPEIPDIPEKVQRFGFFRKTTEKLHETGLPAGRIIDLQTKMDI